MPEPNQKLQNITATQHILFYKEINLSTFKPFSSPAVLVPLFARLCCKPHKSTPAPQHTELSQSLRAQKRAPHISIQIQRKKEPSVACRASYGSFSTDEKGLGNYLMAGSMLASWARGLCCWLGPPFPQKDPCLSQPFKRGFISCYMPWPVWTVGKGVRQTKQLTVALKAGKFTRSWGWC